MDVANDAAELFAASCAPAILPDETVYSWCARFHRLNGGGGAQATSQLLFGHFTAGLRHDFPFHLAHFQNITRGRFGTLSDLLMRGTLYGFHAPFLPADVKDDVRRYLLYGGRSGELHRTLGLSRSGLGLINPLKFCADCVTEQQSQHGCAWWMASHQPPSSFSCRVHYQWLRVADTLLRLGLKDEYCLPEALASVSVANGLHASSSRCSPLTRLGEWGNYIRQQDSLQFAGELLRQSYRLQAKSRGWVTFDGDVRSQKLRDAFLSYYGDILQLFPKEFLGDLAGVKGGFLATLLRKSPSRHHPMKHLLLLSFLFETPEDFMAVYATVTAVQASGGDLAVQLLLRDKAALLVRLVTGGQSINHAAATIGVRPNIAYRHMDMQDIPGKGRCRLIVGTAKEKIISNMLHSGCFHNEIAQVAGVSLSFIKTYLATRPELKTEWSLANPIYQRDIRRQRLADTLRRHPGWKISAIQRVRGNGFQWLHEHDNAWLQQFIAQWKPAVLRRHTRPDEGEDPSKISALSRGESNSAIANA